MPNPLSALLRRANDSHSAATNVTHRSIKVVLLGESGVGKSSLFCRYVYDSFHPFVEPTIGAAFCTRTVLPNPLNGSSQNFVHLNLWDTAGQERYEALTSLYFRNAGAVVLVYDMTRIHSYQAMQRWMRHVQTAILQQQEAGAGAPSTPPVILIVVANKCDLDEYRSIAEADAREYAQSMGAHYVETSAKGNRNVSELFEYIASRALETVEPDANPPKESGSSALVDLQVSGETSRRSCC